MRWEKELGKEFSTFSPTFFPFFQLFSIFFNFFFNSLSTLFQISESRPNFRIKSWKKVEKKSCKKVEVFFPNFFFSPHHPDQMSEGCQVSKVTLWVKGSIEKAQRLLITLSVPGSDGQLLSFVNDYEMFYQRLGDTWEYILCPGVLKQCWPSLQN